MKFKCWSDLHIEGKAFNYVPKEIDKDITLVLAGDIGTLKGGLEAFLIEQCDNFREVLYVIGNHEGYNDNIDNVKKRIRELEATLSNLYFLDNGVVYIDGVRFLGTPLYTNFGNDETLKSQVGNMINDYYITTMNDGHISNKGTKEIITRRLLPQDHVVLYEQAVIWLKNKLDEFYNGKTVVITHWSFTHKLTQEKYKGDSLNKYFNNELEYLCHYYNISDWIYGHVHDRFVIDYGDERFNNTRVICNCRGYSFEDSTFNPNIVFELPTESGFT